VKHGAVCSLTSGVQICVNGVDAVIERGGMFFSDAAHFFYD
jgi:hypothetical protein